MAYQPKFARKPGNPPRNTAPQPEKPRKKRSAGSWALLILLGLVIIPASCFATAALLYRMTMTIGRNQPAQVKQIQDQNVLADFEQYVTLHYDAVKVALESGEKPEIEEVEVEPVRKKYWIEDGVQVAPEPNPACYGQSNDPEELAQVLEDAAWLLEDQPVYFQPDGERYEDSIVQYYLDDSIFAITWKEVHDGSVYTFSEIKVSHPSQFRRHLAGGEYGSEMQYLTTEMAASVNAVVASAGDFYRFRDFGAVVYEGVARRVEGTYAETCYIDTDGNMHFTYGGEVLTVEDVQKFVDENNISFSLAFGPVLVDNYEVKNPQWYGVGEINEGYARAALCQMGPLHYIVATANTQGIYQEIPTVAMFAKNIAATGCQNAYCLDGGQTATIVMNDELVNRPVYGQQRKISDIIYFATAVPEGG